MQHTRAISLLPRAASRRRRSGQKEISIREVGLPSLLPLWLVGGYVVYYVLRYYPHSGLAGADSHAYWLTAHRDSLYSITAGSHDAYVYSPAFAQVVHPLAVLPWPVFATVWSLIEAIAFGWLWAPLGWRWAVPLTTVCAIEIGIGNIYGLLGVALVLAMRHASALAFPLLTKCTPAVGIVWYAARREWRPLAVACGTAAVVAVASYLVAPDQWQQWVDLLLRSRGTDPTVPYHVGAGLLLAAFAARRGKPWMLAPAALLASPVIHGWLPIVLLAAIPRLRALTESTAATTSREGAAP